MPEAPRNPTEPRPAAPVRPSRHSIPLLPIALLLPCGAWLCPGAGWLTDLLANLGAQCALFAIVLAAVGFLRRRPLLGASCTACATLAILGPALQPRAQRASEPANVRVLLLNAAATNPRPDAILRSILEAHPDVLVVLETPGELLDSLRSDAALRHELPYAWLPEAAATGYTAVLTRWPQHGGETLEGGASQTLATGLRAMRIDRPDAPFTLLVLHPRSPRSPERWREGNQLVNHALEVIDDRLRPSGLPLVVAGDLNSAPSAWRSRRLVAGAGLRRAKPFFRAAGTWPSWSFWPLRVAIDDVLVDPDVGVVSWRALPASGSDHSAVLVELAIPTR